MIFAAANRLAIKRAGLALFRQEAVLISYMIGQLLELAWEI